MVVMSHWTAYENSSGLKPGDMIRVKSTGNLYRYVGIAKNGIPDTCYNGDLLRFQHPIPVHPHSLENKYYYFATEKSSKNGFLNPAKQNGLESFIFLNSEIKDFKKDIETVGNISQDLWDLMEQKAQRK